MDYSRGGTAAEHHAALREPFGFERQCVVCSLPTDKLQQSDERRGPIERLEEAIGDPLRMMQQPGARLTGCRSLLRLLVEVYTEVGAGLLVARLYNDAFQICAAHGDRARAAVFAERAYKARIMRERERIVPRRRG
ncbi:Uu.00g123530.m01.CDS01 [Anthostomella pinea]|uniref:Uu.00g123530.m01.CDS01 n=1 Tax=Anthostomella pinea TaxID=933095 RepID=A0AAI8VIF6_9PEZI|nr:Uu.00g123530.m01.CDS01 [Anthostomella pinea]